MNKNVSSSFSSFLSLFGVGWLISLMFLRAKNVHIYLNATEGSACIPKNRAVCSEAQLWIGHT